LVRRIVTMAEKLAESVDQVIEGVRTAKEVAMTVVDVLKAAEGVPLLGQILSAIDGCISGNIEIAETYVKIAKLEKILKKIPTSWAYILDGQPSSVECHTRAAIEYTINKFNSKLCRSGVGMLPPFGAAMMRVHGMIKAVIKTKVQHKEIGWARKNHARLLLWSAEQDYRPAQKAVEVITGQKFVPGSCELGHADIAQGMRSTFRYK
jgi:hypothetical protein